MNLRLFQLAGILLLALALLGCTSTDNGVSAGENVNANIKVIAYGNEILNKTISVKKGTNALQALEMVAGIETKQFSFGKFIETIDGLKPKVNEYWAIYVNGEYSNVGAEGIFLNENTNLMFRIEGFS